MTIAEETSSDVCTDYCSLTSEGDRLVAEKLYPAVIEALKRVEARTKHTKPIWAESDGSMQVEENRSILKVLAMRDTYHVSGPCGRIVPLVEGTESKGVQFIIGMFLVGSHLTSPAIEEFKRHGFQLAVWSQRRRYDPSLIYQSWKTAREHNVTILQSHGYKPAVLAWCLKRLIGLPWVAVVHGHTSENKRIAFYNKLDLWLTRSADRVVAVSVLATGPFSRAEWNLETVAFA